MYSLPLSHLLHFGVVLEIEGRGVDGLPRQQKISPRHLPVNIDYVKLMPDS